MSRFVVRCATGEQTGVAPSEAEARKWAEWMDDDSRHGRLHLGRCHPHTVVDLDAEEAAS